ncbi:cysteine hydrolase family protein [Noviherbaspirillum malthae]|jgi:nicotinamidase-related amidase|uniref:cysteine hydrolase family protein n=1 Tax=Noviherbaspirillum malthae TaxID=1260987 RepID=UPI00188F0DCC|nr:cysteine hydrolase family protein [Noviherbaspirillum malthae]
MTHPTMRRIAGAPATSRLDAATTALIVIDFQQEYFEGGKLPIPDGRSALDKARELVAFADRSGIRVFHVQHVGASGGPLFAADGASSAFHQDILPQPHHEQVRKTTASSFASTDLHARLQGQGIKTLIICGLMTHMCVSTTARDARPLGYQVIVAADASATRDIDAWDGGVVGHAELHRAALTEISDSFGEILRTADILALPVAADNNAKAA